MDGMFAVFDEQPNGSTGGNSIASGARKRRANGEDTGQTSPGSKRVKQDLSDASMGDDNDSEDEDDGVDGDVAQELAAERARRQGEPAPVAADSFQTEHSREIANTGGLQEQNDTESLLVTSQVRHQVALPPNYEYVPLDQHQPPAEPAKTWPFQLDQFQQFAIKSVQRNESVLVSAHTSAGKTVVAEYAIAQSLKNNQRVIYTSPIKALSNQKYRDLEAEFGDVGLLTGDVTIKPEATCLVMTTEILRSMLYRGSEVMREVGWVIFDEVHYLRDKQRGVVWEETIILLPDKVRYVFLSATIPNAYQFAEWIAKTHQQPCHIVYTDYRPTPLQHYLFPVGGDGIHLVVDEKGTFREDNFSRTMAAIAERQGDNPADAMVKRKGHGKDKRFNKGGQKGPSDIFKIIKMIMQKNFNPVIVFSFSKRECEQYALQLSQLSFNDDNEKGMVQRVFDGAIETLTPEDKALPQIQNIIGLLKKGIGIHHSGLLPILKEIIEILFQEGLLKVLFATETFSIGLNMPAKTVVFTSVRKFDGHSNRWVSPSEFIQMSGRAGRRGKDERGIVIMMIDEKMEPAIAKEIVRGEQDKLHSAFHLGYNMILNLLRVEGVNPEHMLEHCFYQFQNIASVSGLEKQLHEADVERANITVPNEPAIKEYYDIRRELEKNCNDMHDTITNPAHCLKFLQEGRLIRVKLREHDFGWGVVIRIRRTQQKDLPKVQKPQDAFTLDVAMATATDSDAKARETDVSVLPATPDGPRKWRIVPIVLSAVYRIGKVRLFMDLRSLRSDDAREMSLIQQSMDEILRRGPAQIMDPVKDMHISDPEFKKTTKKVEILEERLNANALAKSSKLPNLYEQYSRKMEYKNKARSLKKSINSALSILQLDELKCRKRVLRRLGFINEADVVQLKARVACEISTGDELVLSELLFNRFFNEMSSEQAVALLSCFIFEERAEEPKRIRDDLAGPFKEIQKQARAIAKVSIDSKLPVDEDEYVQGFKPHLLEVVYAWTKGATFLQITKMTDVFEGSLIRLFRRLEELIRQMSLAAKVMGNEELEQKFDDGLTKLRRDIVSAQSLYL